MFSVLVYILLPLAFVAHEVEELLTYPRFAGQQANKLAAMMPKSRPLLSLFEWVSVKSFLLVSSIYFVLMCVAAVLLIYDVELLTFIVVGGFLVHLLVHIVHSIVLRQYVPGLVSSVLLLPVWYIYMVDIVKLYPNLVWLAIIVGGVVVFYVINCVFLFFCTRRRRASGKGKVFEIQ